MTFKGIKQTGEPEMAQQIAALGSTADSCPSGQTLLLIAIFGIDIPCSHILSIGAKRPKIGNVQKLKLADIDPLVKEISTYHIREIQAPSADRISYLKKMVSGSTDRNSQTKKIKKQVKT
jgi:hypothetical protein